MAFEKEKPDTSHINGWIKSLDNPQIYRLVDQYIDTLGPGLLAEMGYSFNQIKDTVKIKEPKVELNKHSVDFNALMANTHEVLLENKRLKVQLEFKKKEIDKLQDKLKGYKT